MTKHLAGSLDNGYILFAPLECTTTYLIDKCGRQVHSWKSKYGPGFSAYMLPDGNLLRTGTYKDTSIIKGSNGGIIEKIDWDGNIVWSYLLFNDSMGQHHDIYPMENGNILVISRHVISEIKAIANGRIPGTFGGPKLYSERIVELKPTGTNEAQVVWQWSLWDHLIQDQDANKPGYGSVVNHPELMNINFAPVQTSDWIHINSIDYNAELDQILLSCKSLNEIWIIDHSTTTKEAASHKGGNAGMGGDIVYRWGNPLAYNKGTKSDQKLFHQHNAHWINQGYKDGGDIMVFNNGLSRVPGYSTVEILTPPVRSKGSYTAILPYGPMAPKWIYKDSVPENFFSGFKSGADRLPNGSTLICSGLTGKFFEVDSNNSIVWEYINPVAPDDRILKDGQSGGSVVFKCIFYSDTFSGFKNKILTPSKPIEKEPYPYFCISNLPDSISPVLVSIYPPNKAKQIELNTKITLTFNEKIFKGNQGSICIYENTNVKEIIPISDPKINVTENMVSITTTTNYSSKSKITISIDSGCFRDFSGNDVQTNIIKNWSFKTR